ncbi:MAG: 5'-nucleotidase C-terminal domain-containing protein [Nitrospira sp.]|nr:5'-nucleotidase C-terminal domain-containing protein [Nitrospira sp.]
MDTRGIILERIARLAVMGTLHLCGICTILPVGAGASVEHHSHELDRDDEADDTIEARQDAGRRLEWRSSEFHPEERDSHLHVQLLAINDFHGQLSEGRLVANRPVGGAAVLAAYLHAAQHDPKDRDLSDRTFIVHAGDHVGATPPESALLQDEPSIGFLNLLANRYCRYEDRREDRDRRRGWEDDEAQEDRRDRRMHPKCNLVGTPGNHEFDEGKDELFRLLNGGNHASGPFLENPYRGARYPTVSSNVVDQKTGKPILPPFGNSLVRMELTGQQIFALLNQQWANQSSTRILKTSGLTYTWDNNRPIGDRIVEVLRNGSPIDRQATFSVTVNSFMAAGGDNFTVLLQGKNQVGGPLDLDALITYIQTLPQPFSAAIEGRIIRLN